MVRATPIPYMDPPLLFPKVKFFLWKAIKNVHSTGENLQKRTYLSTLDTRIVERLSLWNISSFTATLQKRFGAMISGLLRWFINDDASFSAILQLSYSWKRLSHIGIRGNLLPWIFWNLWTSWNKLVFKNRQSQSFEILSQAIHSARE